MAFIPPQGNQTVMVDNSNNIVYPASFQKVVANQATIAGNNFTSVPSVIDPENATTTQLPSVASVVSYVSDVVEGGSSGLIPTIQSDIQTLGQVKSNRGEFWFECGALTTTNKMPLNTPFSCIWTMAMTQEEFKKHKTYFPKIIGNLGYWNDAGYGWCISRIDSTSLIGIGANNGSGSGKYNQLDIINYLDGNPHIWSVVYNGTNISLYIDNVKKTSLAFTFESSEATNPLGIGSTPTSTTQNYGVWGKFSRIKYFNFDMYADDAPYTIDDYIAGKDESPLLKLGMLNYQASAFTYASASASSYPCSVISDRTNDRIVITTSGDITSDLVWVSSGNSVMDIPSSAFVEASYTSIENATNLSLRFYNGGTRVLSTSSFNAGDSITINTSDKITRVDILANKSGGFATGEVITITGLKIKLNGALLSLDDYSIKVGATRIIPDVSSNNNDATITGSFYGSKDNSIAKMAQLFYQSQQG